MICDLLSPFPNRFPPESGRHLLRETSKGRNDITDCIMKKTHTCRHNCNIPSHGTKCRSHFHWSITLAASAILATSCIFDAPGDEFYQTLWHSEENPLGPFDISTLTLEFLCNGSVSITTTASPASADDGVQDQTEAENPKTIYGEYSPDGAIAVLENLHITLRGLEVTFIEAHLSGDTLFLLWRIENSVYPFTTALNYLSPDSDQPTAGS